MLKYGKAGTSRSVVDRCRGPSSFALVALLGLACAKPDAEPNLTPSPDASAPSAWQATPDLDAGPKAAREPVAAPDSMRDADVSLQDAAVSVLEPSDAQVPSGLPCALRDLLAQRCWECHGALRKFGAPLSLVSWDDLLQPAVSQKDSPTFRLALARAQDDARPMPPAPHARLTGAELALLSTWAESGTPRGTTDCGPPPAVTMQPVGVPKPADCEATYELRAHGGDRPDDTSKYNVGAQLDDRQYQCFYFDAPYGDDSSMFWYEPLLDNVQHVHHWILYATDNLQHPSGSTGRCNSAEPGSHFVAGWGPGTNNVLPDDVGLLLQSGPRAGLVLELHYYNDSAVPQQDASGVRFCTGARKNRAHVAAVHSTGTEGICIEPGKKLEVAGMCHPRTDMGDIHITGLWPHMHKLARRMVLTIERSGGATEVIHDAPFDFGAQTYHAMNDVVLHPGDSLETRCFYDNDTTTRTRFGEGTRDEMCYGFITAWPAGALSNRADVLSGLRSDLLDRCADPVSVLASCNGIADAL